MSNLESSDTALPFPPDRCGFAHTAQLLGDRWILVILRELFYGVAKFEDMRRDIGIPKSILSTRLSGLIEAGLVEKRPYKPEGARTRMGYHLSRKGRDLALAFIGLLEWGNRHMPISGDKVRPVDAETGRPLRLALVDEVSGEEVALRQVRLSDSGP